MRLTYSFHTFNLSLVDFKTAIHLILFFHGYLNFCKCMKNKSLNYFSPLDADIPIKRTKLGESSDDIFLFLSDIFFVNNNLKFLDDIFPFCSYFEVIRLINLEKSFS